MIAPASMLTWAVALLWHPAYAQTGKSTAPQPPAAAQACVACHGAQGEGNPAARVPRIAGQPQYYLARQLESYVNGSRRNAVMESIAKSLSPEIRNALAGYYAQIDVAAAKSSGDTRKNERGHQLATKGDAQRRVQACNNCHGPGGIGEPPAMPYLAGLDGNYLASTLNAWKDGTRRTDAGQQMATVAKAMAAEDIAAVAQYYAGLPPPKPWPTNVVQAPAPRTKPAPGTTPTAQQTTGAQPGVGIEHGAPRGGGTQGEGAVGESMGGAPRSPRQAPEPGDASKAKASDASGASKTAVPVADDAPKSQGPRIDGKALSEGDPARGRALVASGAYGCAACHAIPNIRSPRGIVGPSLAGISDRPFIAGQLPNRPDVLVAFLQDPPALIPKTGMPNVGLTEQQARDIAAFLSTRRP